MPDYGGIGTAPGCNGGCHGMCLGCGTTCSDGCSGRCAPGCTGTCGKGVCRGSCGNGSGGGSGGGGCSSCNGSCVNSCDTYCNKDCESDTAKKLKDSLKLTKKFEAQNMKDIATLILAEVGRRPSITTTTKDTSKLFDPKTKITADDINKVIYNLNLLDDKYHTTYSAEQKSKGLKALGQDLVKNVLDAADEEVKIP